MKLALAEKIRELDRCAIDDYGIPGVVLMENAGKGTVDIIMQRFGDMQGRMVAIFVGPGNNGGDGFVIARHLHQLGALPQLFLLVGPEKIKGDAALNYEVVKKLPIPLYPLLVDDDLKVATPVISHSKLLVDAILGTGLKRVVDGHFGKVIELLNGSGRSILAVDIPSGLDSDSGQSMGACVQAEFTATYGLAKPGQVLYPGGGFCGDLHIVDIGIPPEIVAEASINIELLQKNEVAMMVPPRTLNSHKGSYGHILIVAGSQGKTGAALLAGQGALRSGSGLVSMCVPAKLNGIFEAALAEAMTVPMGSEWCFSIDDYAAIENAMHAKNAIILGPGIGSDSDTVPLVKKLYCDSPLPMVVDADGLNSLAGCFDKIDRPSAARVLTPHPGEMAKLTGLTTKDIQADRIGTAASFAVDQGVVVVLKGAATVIASPDGRVAVNSTGNPAMAAGGMGDVLAGVIGSLLGQGVPTFQAASLGVYVHGLAADRLATNNRVGFGILPSEVANELPLAFQDILDTM